MPHVPIADRAQKFSTGINCEAKLGRSSTTTKEWDIREFKVQKRTANQDKTGSMGQGHEDHESGVIGHTVTITFINEVSDPNDLWADNNCWYADLYEAGHARFTGYLLFDSYESGAVVNADHTITVSAKTVIRKEGATVVKPTWTKYTA
jgi:hypothetical protein